MQTDFLIIGQGIAGSLLADELLKRNQKILVVDNNHSAASSIIAAGLFNPIVFKRFVKSWRADELIPFAAHIYTELEKKLKKRFYFQKNIIKIFASEDEFKFWEVKRQENPFMATATKHNPSLEKTIYAPFGTGEVFESGNVNISLLLNEYKEFLTGQKLLISGKINYNDIIIEEEGLSWKDIRAKKIIFCEGHQATNNPYFTWLPFKLTKGELLTVEIKELQTDKVINKGVFILPIARNTYRVGATYKWDEFSETITEEGKSELTQKLEKLLKVPYRILQQEAGIRPTVSDRRPLLGVHPVHGQLLIFNGMGTKGVLIAPFFASHFADYITGKISTLDREVDIKRISKKSDFNQAKAF